MVEYKNLEEFAKCEVTKNRLHISENAYSITQNGLVPTKEFFKEKTHVTSSDTSGYYIVEKNWFVYSPSRIDVGSINYLRVEGPVIVSPMDVVFSIDENKCTPAYLLHFLLSHKGMKELLRRREGVEGTGRRNLPFKYISSIKIPLPSIDEQIDLVNKLDTFSTLITKLDEEIELRKKQLEYYRDQLLDVDEKDGVEMMTLEESCEIKTGKGITQNDCSDEGGYPVISGGKSPMGFYHLYNREPHTVTVSRVGAYAGFVSYITERFYLNDKCFSVIPYDKSAFLNKYLYSVLKASESSLMKLQSEGGVPTINTQKLGKIQIPIPSISEQKMIVVKLDAFTSLISKLQEERDLRQKQYEYYREKLLTFE